MTDFLNFLQTVVQSNWFLPIAGWVVGFVSAVYLDRCQDRRQARRIRAMLVQEVDHDLALVNQLQKEAEEILQWMQSLTKSREEQVILLRGRLEIPSTIDTHSANAAFLRRYGRSWSGGGAR